MSQVLKEEIKNKIIKSAKSELLKNGYEKASLRKIALKSGVTVGNLYRYFDNKEVLVNSIISPMIIRINNILKTLSDNSISFDQDVKNANLDRDKMISVLNSVGSELSEIYLQNRDELVILLMHFEKSTNLKTWLSDLIFNFISNNYELNGKEEQMKMMSKAYGAAVISGFIELLSNKKLPKESVKNMINIYLGSYVGLLDTDIYRLAGEK